MATSTISDIRTARRRRSFRYGCRAYLHFRAGVAPPAIDRVRKAVFFWKAP
jgi:hypothetical protein